MVDVINQVFTSYNVNTLLFIYGWDNAHTHTHKYTQYNKTTTSSALCRAE